MAKKRKKKKGAPGAAGDPQQGGTETDRAGTRRALVVLGSLVLAILGLIRLCSPKSAPQQIMADPAEVPVVLDSMAPDGGRDTVMCNIQCAAASNSSAASLAGCEDLCNRLPSGTTQGQLENGLRCESTCLSGAIDQAIASGLADGGSMAAAKSAVAGAAMVAPAGCQARCFPGLAPPAASTPRSER